MHLPTSCLRKWENTVLFKTQVEEHMAQTLGDLLLWAVTGLLGLEELHSRHLEMTHICGLNALRALLVPRGSRRNTEEQPPRQRRVTCGARILLKDTCLGSYVGVFSTFEI